MSCPVAQLGALLASQCGYPERFAQQALGHNSKAVHHAYSRHAEVIVPSLDDWEKQWKKNPQEMEKPKVVALDFQGQQHADEAERAALWTLGRRILNVGWVSMEQGQEQVTYAGHGRCCCQSPPARGDFIEWSTPGTRDSFIEADRA
jgi:hypothetical protein